jgi:hypothetical protein
MSTPAIAHFGTTIAEPAPSPDVSQRDVPIEGDLAATLRFLELSGFEPLLENFYPGIGRQYIWRRGRPGDVDYLEQDNFTSYSARPRPATPGPRVGDTVFRLTHREPRALLAELEAEGLARIERGPARERFLAGDCDWLLLAGPNGQCYELGGTQPTVAGNHVIYVWTQASELEAVTAAHQQHFGLRPVSGPVSGPEEFHGLGSVRRLSRERPGVTIGLLHDPVAGLSPRFSDDIFGVAGYSHYRLGALDQAATAAAHREAFPPAGDVSFVYFADSYLELVQA